MKSWIGLVDFHTNTWSNVVTVKDWWLAISSERGPQRKGILSAAKLVSVEVYADCPTFSISSDFQFYYLVHET
jgi:hypothetical protein